MVFFVFEKKNPLYHTLISIIAAARPSLVSPAVAKVASMKMPPSPASSKKTNESSSKIPASKPTGYVPYRGALKPFTDRATLNKMAERNPNLKSR